MGIAELWLTFLVAAALIYGLQLYLRGDYSAWETALFLPAYLMSRLLWRVHFTNEPPDAIREGAILAANHRSSIDPMFIQLAARRRVHWMVAKEYCQNIVFGPVLQALQVIPTNRTGTDINSTKIAMSLAKQGKLVGMFPEGRINVTPDPLLPLRAGAAMIAAKASVPIIPIYIQGSPYQETYSVVSPFLIRTRVKVTFGRPILPSTGTGNVNSNGSCQELSSPSSEVKEDAGASEANSVGMEVSLEQSSGNRRSLMNAQSDTLMRGWAQEILVLSGRTDFEVSVGSSAARRRK